MATKRVLDPQGTQWLLRRKWMPRRLRWRRFGRRGSADYLDAADLPDLDGDLPVIGVILAAIGIALALLAFFVLVVPALVFLVELLITVLLVGLGVAGRVLFRRPWTIEARRRGTDHVYEWKVVGWRASGELLESLAEQLHQTGRPSGGVRVPPDSEPG